MEKQDVRAAKSFTEILEMRGRIVIFTASAPVGLRFEQHAERHHARIIHTRGWADAYGPLSLWSQINSTGEYAVLSCDQKRYVEPHFKLPCTDLVWIGECGDPLHVPWLYQAFLKAMARGSYDMPIRKWLLGEGAL